MLLENKKTHLAFVSLMRLQNKAKNFKETFWQKIVAFEVVLRSDNPDNYCQHSIFLPVKNITEVLHEGDFVDVLR